MENQETTKLAILGSGSWGCTMAAMLAEQGHSVRLWGRQQARLDELRDMGHPPGVPELVLPEMIMSTDLGEATDGARAAVIAVRSQAVGDVCRALAGLAAPPPLIVIASKGLDLETLQPLSEVAAQALPEGTQVAVLSGPCIAREVAQQSPASAVAACTNAPTAESVQRWFASPTFRVYRSSDVLGVEYAGATKNVIAIAAGASDGLGFGANAKSALITRGLAEMRRFAMALGAEDLTVTGLAGLGDLCVTCFSPHSRNRRFGEALSSGEAPSTIQERFGEVVEGVPTARAVVAIAARHGLEVPVAQAVCHLIDGTWSPQEATEKLMRRELKAEF